MKRSNVICVHIGARAHYLIPQALQEKGNLHTLITDTWVGAGWLRQLLSRLPLTVFKSLAGRYNASIPADRVSSFGLRFLLFEFYLRVKYSYSWDLTLARDQKFELEAFNKITKIQGAEIVLGISYTSLQCFKAAKKRGLKTILFQVDPGIEEENLVAACVEKYSQTTSWERAPKQYWEQWKAECELADTIFVNSQWSKKGLIKQGVDETKIQIVPLPYNIQEKHRQFKKIYPVQFTEERPLRCLFLGTLALRKGIHVVIEAAKALQGLPIEFIFVGRNEINEADFQCTNIYYKGIVSREETDKCYQEADVFLFPTFSDGFGLTQLEAMAWQLPIIASTHCGSVVQEALNGWLLKHIEAEEIEYILKTILENPVLLKKYASNCLARAEEFNTERFAEELDRLLVASC